MHPSMEARLETSPRLFVSTTKRTKAVRSTRCDTKTSKTTLRKLTCTTPKDTPTRLASPLSQTCHNMNSPCSSSEEMVEVSLKTETSRRTTSSLLSRAATLSTG